MLPIHPTHVRGEWGFLVICIKVKSMNLKHSMHKKFAITPQEVDFFLLHLSFGVICVIVLAIDFFSVGLRLFVLVTLYNIAVPLLGKWRGYLEWIDLWIFVFY